MIARGWPILLALLVLACGCNEVSVSDGITQKQANEIVAALSTFGIPAEVEKSGRSQGAAYSVTVRRKNFVEAVRVMQERKLPSDPEASFEELIAQRGLLPNSREIEGLRADRAMAKELEELLENHAGIVSARTLVRNFSADAETKTVVSLVLQVRDGVTLERQEVAQLVQKAMPNMAPDDINIVISTQDNSKGSNSVVGAMGSRGQVVTVPLVPFLLWRVPDADRYGLAFALLTVLAATIVVGIAIGFSAASLRARRRQPRELVEAGTQPAVAYEKDRGDLLGA